MAISSRLSFAILRRVEPDGGHSCLCSVELYTGRRYEQRAGNVEQCAGSAGRLCTTVWSMAYRCRVYAWLTVDYYTGRTFLANVGCAGRCTRAHETVCVELYSCSTCDKSGSDDVRGGVVVCTENPICTGYRCRLGLGRFDAPRWISSVNLCLGCAVYFACAVCVTVGHSKRFSPTRNPKKHA